MKERLQAVQRLFWALLFVSLALLGATLSGGNNGATMRALVELTQFLESFDQRALEGSLLEHARAQGRLPLATVAADAAAAPGVPDMSAAPDASLEPYADVALSTLGAIVTHHVPTDVRLGVADRQGLRTGLAFHLARRGSSDAVRVLNIELVAGLVTTKDLATLKQTEAARLALIKARKAHGLAQKKFERLEELLKNRRKWRAHWKVLKKTNEKRVDAMHDRNARKKELNDALHRYQGLATQAEAFEMVEGKADADLRIARVTAKQGDKELAFAFPVAIKQQEVTLPALTGVEFSRTRRAGLWDTVKGLGPAQAVQEAVRHFGWHYAHTDVGPFKIGGMTVLQLWPLMFPIMLAMLRVRVRSVSGSYDPYGNDDFDLPRVGGGASWFDAVVLAVLPTTAAAMSALALWEIDQLPVVGAACTFACATLGPWATLELRELRGLKNAVRYSHSNPPPSIGEA